MQPLAIALLFGLIEPLTTGQDPQPVAGPARVRVQCNDVAGKPVAGAEVYLFQSRRLPDGTGDLQASGPHTSGEDGVAVAAVALEWDGGKFNRWAYARVPGKQVGAARVMRWDNSPVDPQLTIRLLPSREVRGRLRTPEGVRPETARVFVATLWAIVDGNVMGQVFPRDASMKGLERSLPAIFDRTPEADGSFVFTDMPPEPFLVLAVEGPGLAYAQWGNSRLPGRKIPDVVELTAEAESVLGGTVRDSEGHAVRGAEVHLRISHEAQAPYLQSFRTLTDDAGRFRLAGLPAGPFDLFVESAAGVLRPRTLRLAKAEVVAGLAIGLEPGVEVAGTVTAQPGAAPIEGAGISVVTDEPGMQSLGSARTDAQGRFRLRLPEGKAKLYFGSIPAGFVRPDPSTTWPLEVRGGDKDLQNMNLVLERAK